MTRQQQAEQIVSRWWSSFGLSARLTEEARNALVQDVVDGLVEAATAELEACVTVAEAMKGTESEFGPLHAIGLAEAAERIAERIRARASSLASPV